MSEARSSEIGAETSWPERSRRTGGRRPVSGHALASRWRPWPMAPAERRTKNGLSLAKNQREQLPKSIRSLARRQLS